MNTFGNIFRLTTFGESHGTAVGGIIDGMPAGIEVDEAFLQAEMDRRRPGQSAITTGRSETDRVELLSGIFEGKTTGTPIGFEVRNANQHSSDYENIRDLYRPSHADYTYQQKYGLRDHRGGGRSSARETLSRVVGGAFAKMALRKLGIDVKAYTSQVGDICLDNDWTKYDLNTIEQNAVRCPDAQKAALMEQLIRDVKAEGDTIGGVISCVIQGVHKYYRIYPKAMNILDDNFIDATRIMGLKNSKLQYSLRTSNRIERLNRELRRRDLSCPEDRCQSQRRDTGRHLQRSSHLFPLCIQARCNTFEAHPYRYEGRQGNNPSGSGSPRSLRPAACRADSRSDGSNDDT